MVDEIRELYAYNRWANARTREAAFSLASDEIARDLGSSFPSVLATLAHIASAEWVWLERWCGRSPAGMPGRDGLDTISRLQAFWADVETRQAEFLTALSDTGLQRVVSYSNTRGVPFQAPLWQLMRHVVNHSSYHRGQVATMMRQLGARAPATDLVLYYREMTTQSATEALPGPVT